MADFTVSRNVSDLRQVRLTGTNKSLEELTVGELTQLRPGGAAADDGWTITAEASTVSVNGSSILLNLMQERGIAAVQAEQKTQTDQLKTQAALTSTAIKINP
jgi:hypothetical protein